VNATPASWHILALGYAVGYGRSFKGSTVSAISVLLAFGASPSVIPIAFSQLLHCDMPKGGPPAVELDDLNDENKIWCNEVAWVKLASTFTLMQRYILLKAATMPKRSPAEHQVAHRHGPDHLPDIHCFLIDQVIAGAKSIDEILN
jgi:hypothetical protein